MALQEEMGKERKGNAIEVKRRLTCPGPASFASHSSSCCSAPCSNEIEPFKAAKGNASHVSDITCGSSSATLAAKVASAMAPRSTKDKTFTNHTSDQGRHRGHSCCGDTFTALYGEYSTRACIKPWGLSDSSRSAQSVLVTGGKRNKFCSVGSSTAYSFAWEAWRRRKGKRGKRENTGGNVSRKVHQERVDSMFCYYREPALPLPGTVNPYHTNGARLLRKIKQQLHHKIPQHRVIGIGGGSRGV